jgi:hypothetical protein
MVLLVSDSAARPTFYFMTTRNNHETRINKEARRTDNLFGTQFGTPPRFYTTLPSSITLLMKYVTAQRCHSSLLPPRRFAIPRGMQRMTRGPCGLLVLQWSGTFTLDLYRSPGAHCMYIQYY